MKLNRPNLSFRNLQRQNEKQKDMYKKLQVLTFLYHEVVDSPTDSGFQRKSAIPYKHGVQEFKDNIDIIVKNSELITTIKQLETNTNNKATLVAFDDGGKSNITSASYLEKYNVKGHFFITTNLIGDPYFMNETQLVELHRQGHIIGSHSHTHPNVFKSLSYDEMVEEWSKSKNILENLLKCPIDSCSIPGGDANMDAYRSAIACGYKYIFDSEPTVKIRNMDGAYILGRFCPKRGTKYSEIEKLSNFRGIAKQKIIRELKKTAKIILYPIYSKIHNSRKHGDL